LPAVGMAAPIDRYTTAIRAKQTTDGAIVMGTVTPTANHIVPYFANLAALALAEAPGYTNLNAAKSWANFYRARMKADGTVDDQNGQPGAWTSTGTRDSTDSYASTFLEVMDAIRKRDPAWTKLRFNDITRAVGAIKLTLQPNGLTLAKPDWPVMYTMDNVEVWRGMNAAVRLATSAGKADSATAWTAIAIGVEVAIERDLWDTVRGSYRIGIQPDGGKMEGLEQWYPDVMANLMAIGWGKPSTRHTALYTLLLQRFGTNLPTVVQSEDDLDVLTWWAFAARARADKARFAALSSRLAAWDPAVVTTSNPALLGHVCRLLSTPGARRVPVERK
jgi:hypothetical protein